MSLLREIFQRNKTLAWFGLLNFLAFGVLLLASFFDDRTLLGINIWIKPMKFSISIAIFSWTMAWFLDYLPQKNKAGKIAFWITLMLLLEQIIIIGQAYRGQTSHFNVTTLFNGILFQIMGTAIFVNTLMVFWAFILIAKADQLPQAYLWGIRLGMLIFIFASLEGFLMAANLGHTVGAADGQEGIFFLNWAKAYGDLRVFHFFGLHALQIIPLFAWYVARGKKGWVTGFAVFYFLLSTGTLLNALLGRGLLDFGV